MKSMSVAGALCAALLAMASPSQASVIDAFTVNPNPVNAGNNVTLDLQLTLSPDSGYSGIYLTGGSVTFDSGFGPSTVLSIPTSNPTFADINTTFNYATVGNYNPSFSATVFYNEWYTYYTLLGYNTVIVGYHSCGVFGSSSCPDYATFPYYGYVTATNSFQTTLTGYTELAVLDLTVGNEAPTATPLPAALPLFAGGLGLIGLLARRRKQKQAA
jgi:hypothetical protein